MTCLAIKQQTNIEGPCNKIRQQLVLPSPFDANGIDSSIGQSLSKSGQTASQGTSTGMVHQFQSVGFAFDCISHWQIANQESESGLPLAKS